jgi:hypothetical protein
VTSAKIVELIIKPLAPQAPVRENSDVSFIKMMSKTYKTKKDFSVYTTG